MNRTMLRAKLHRATVTGADLQHRPKIVLLGAGNVIELKKP
jgi:aspartate 1-decarboxylase